MTPALTCKFYAQGVCAYGDACHFYHPSRTTPVHTAPAASRSRTQPICAHFLRGTCAYGSACIRSHTVDATQSTTNPPVANNTRPAPTLSPFARPLKAPICKYFAKNGCAKGDACPFVHPPRQSIASGPGRSIAPSRTNASSVAAASASMGIPIRGPCKFFTRGECMKGDSCEFQHSIADIEPAPRPAVDRSWRSRDEQVVASAEQENQDVPTSDAQSSESETSKRALYSCDVTFSSGAAVLGIQTAFESQHIIISNLPPAISQQDVISLAEPFGLIEKVLLDTEISPTFSVARLSFARPEEAETAVRSLDHTTFRQLTLSAHLDLRAVQSGSASKLKISYPAPSIIAWAHYPAIHFAQNAAKRIDGKLFNGRNISAAFQMPKARQTCSFSVEIKGLPLSTTQEGLRKFSGAQSLTIRKAPYDRSTSIRDVRETLERIGALDAFDVLPADDKKTKITAFAQFSEGGLAEQAVTRLNKTCHRFLGGAPTWLEFIHSFKYTIPRRQFELVRSELDALPASYPECNLRYYERDEHGALVDVVAIRVYSDIPKWLARVKTVVEHILKGELLADDEAAIWNNYFDTEAGAQFLETHACAGLEAYAKRDARMRNIHLFGSDTARGELSGRIRIRLAAVEGEQRVLPLDRGLFQSLVKGGLAALRASLGFAHDALRLDIVRKALVVHAASEDELRRLRERLQLLSGHQAFGAESDADCPVCFCDVDDAVELPCAHACCRACLQLLLESRAGPGFAPLKCVREQCASEIPLRVVANILSPTKESLLLRAAFLSHIHARPDEFHYCPTPDCEVVYRTSAEGTLLRCPACLVRICPACHVEAHDGLSCAEQRDHVGGGHGAYDRYRRENDIRPCPSCKTDLQKDGGCNHVHCIRCRAHICWVCMQVFDDADSGGGVYNHMRQAHGGFYS